MLKKVINSLSILLSVMLFNGCGGTETTKGNISNIPAHEGKLKINRTDWEDVNRPGESSLGYLKKSLDNGVIEINLDYGDVVGKYIQFFIDSDANDATGYSNEYVNGADYLIEEGRIYKSTADGPRWNWKQIADAQFDKTDSKVYAKTTTDIIPNISKNYRVAATSLSNSWEIVSNILMKPLARDSIIIDADSSDWNAVAVLASSDIGSLKVTDDGKKIYFLIENGNVGKHTQIYINIDQNINTGYKSNILNDKSGAEYLIEDDRLYKSTANGSKWLWDHVGYVNRAKDNNLIEISVLKSSIEVNEAESTISIGAVGWDESYSNVVSHLGMNNVSFHGQKSLIISEVMATNAHTILDPDFYQFSDWLEISNQSTNDIDIGNYKLSDKINKPSWTIPAGTIIPARSKILFWADGKDSVANGYHTNFKFKSKGEAVALFDANGELIDGFEFGKQKPDISCAFVDNKVVYMHPTPNADNSSYIKLLNQTDKPVLSLASGFYDVGQTVTITAKNGAVIYYTTDGSFPTKDSPIYQGAISFDTTTIIRARALEDGKLLSGEVTHTYFIGEESTLPIISIATDSKYLWDDTIGIYTVGTNGIKQCEIVANYNQPWKRPAHIEYFDKNKNLGFSQEVEIKISGQCSRKRAQKSLSIKADDKYGEKMISYKLFDEKDINQFKSFKLRNAGQDWYEAMIRDALSQRLIKDDFNVDYQAYKPSILFINGEYWGIHNIREKRNEDYLASNYPNLNPKKVDILYGGEDEVIVKEGEADDYLDLLDYIKDHSLADDEHYQYISQKIDIDNFIDYQIAQIYIGNYDWPVNNIRYWKEQKDGAKWRWMMDDQDSSFNLFNEFGNEHNTLELATTANTDEWRNPPESTFLLRSLLENEKFKTTFVNKFRGYLATTFKPVRVKALINSMKDVIEPEIPRHIERWTGDYPKNPFLWDISAWYKYINRVLDFADKRADIVNDHLNEKFGN